MKKELIFAIAMSMVSSLAFAANDSASDANSNAANPKGSFDSTPPATGDKGYGTYNGSTGEKAPKAGAGVSGSTSGSSGSGGASGSASSSTERSPSDASSSTSGAYEGTASDSTTSTTGATASAKGDMSTFTKLDKNKDGSLSKSEARKDKTVSKSFEQIDTDKDGKISQAEYQAWIGGNTGSGTTGSSGAAPGLKTDPAAGSQNRGATDTGMGTSGGAKSPDGNNIR